MIYKDQQNYLALRNIIAERTSAVTFFVGAGLSVPAKLPTWGGLRTTLCKALSEKAARSPDPNEQARLKHDAETILKEDYWVAFERLRGALGQSTYRQVIRDELSKGTVGRIPRGYLQLWRLRPRGILTLNIDKFVTRAHSQEHPGIYVSDFSGRDISRNTHVLQNPHAFIANLHGVLDDESTWIFTHSDLRALRGNPGYKAFLTSCITTTRIVFVGITAEDIAAGGHLQSLRDSGIDLGNHFWITERTDLAAQNWADAAGVRLITYDAPNYDHSQLYEMLDDLASFRPQDESAAPVVITDLDGPAQTTKAPSKLLEPDELASMRPDFIRNTLNIAAAAILDSNDPARYKQFEAFTDRYDEAIYRAWYVKLEYPYNRLFDYTLVSEIATGAFGRVFKAERASDGAPVAIKLLREEVRRKPEMLQSFRRGVRSMKILSHHSINGMVPYHEASEIPAFAVMDLIEGPNLKTAVQAKYLEDWASILRVADELSSVVKQAHELPERVLHRDIRPSNIMLKNYFIDPDSWEVVVLDFDLSWHRDASEMSVLAPEVVTGYLAPEQVHATSNVSTRVALVDSFGLGMTLFFLASGREPIFAQHRHVAWKRELQEIGGLRPCKSWRSLPARFARMIDNATKDKQSERWDVGQILMETRRLRHAENAPLDVRSAELLAEELIHRAELGHTSTWLEDTLTVRAVLPSDVTISCSANEAENLVEISIDYSDSGTSSRRNVSKYLPEREQKANSALKSYGWAVRQSNRSQASLSIRATISTQILAQRMDETALGVSELGGLFRFS